MSDQKESQSDTSAVIETGPQLIESKEQRRSVYLEGARDLYAGLIEIHRQGGSDSLRAVTDYLKQLHDSPEDASPETARQRQALSELLLSQEHSEIHGDISFTASLLTHENRRWQHDIEEVLQPLHRIYWMTERLSASAEPSSRIHDIVGIVGELSQSVGLLQAEHELSAEQSYSYAHHALEHSFAVTWDHYHRSGDRISAHREKHDRISRGERATFDVATIEQCARSISTRMDLAGAQIEQLMVPPDHPPIGEPQIQQVERSLATLGRYMRESYKIRDGQTYRAYGSLINARAKISDALIEFDRSEGAQEPKSHRSRDLFSEALSMIESSILTLRRAGHALDEEYESSRLHSAS